MQAVPQAQHLPLTGTHFLEFFLLCHFLLFLAYSIFHYKDKQHRYLGKYKQSAVQPVCFYDGEHGMFYLLC